MIGKLFSIAVLIAAAYLGFTQSETVRQWVEAQYARLQQAESAPVKLAHDKATEVLRTFKKKADQAVQDAAGDKRGADHAPSTGKPTPKSSTKLAQSEVTTAAHDAAATDTQAHGDDMAVGPVAGNDVSGETGDQAGPVDTEVAPQYMTKEARRQALEELAERMDMLAVTSLGR